MARVSRESARISSRDLGIEWVSIYEYRDSSSRWQWWWWCQCQGSEKPSDRRSPTFSWRAGIVHILCVFYSTDYFFLSTDSENRQLGQDPRTNNGAISCPPVVREVRWSRIGGENEYSIFVSFALTSCQVTRRDPGFDWNNFCVDWEYYCTQRIRK